MSKINTIYSVVEVAEKLDCSEATVKNKCSILFKTNGCQYVSKVSGVWIISNNGIDKIKGMIQSVGRPCKECAIPLNKRKINKKVL